MVSQAFVLWVMLKTATDTSLRSETYSSEASCIRAADHIKESFSTSLVEVRTDCTKKDD